MALRDESLKKPQIEEKDEEEDMPPQDEESSTAGLETKDLNSTENTIFHKRFQLPESEVLIESKLFWHTEELNSFDVREANDIRDLTVFIIK